MKSLTRRVLALFLALTMVLDMAMPVWAEEVNGTDNQASKVVTCVEDDCDCCDHEHEHEHEHIEASKGLVATNPEKKVEEPEKEEKGFFEKIGEGISNLVSNIAKVVAPEKEEVEEPEEIEEELEEEEEIPDTEIPTGFVVMAAPRVMMNVSGAVAPTPKDTSWAEGRPSAAHRNCVYEANLNDCTAQVSCKYDGFMHWVNCGGTARYFTAHNFPERSGCEEETVECTRCYQTYTYLEEHEFPDRTSCAAQTVKCTKCNETKTYPAVNHTYTKNQVEEKAGDDTYHYIYCDTCNQITTVAHNYQSVQTYDCAKHKYVCRDCGHVKYENHTWGNYNKCTICKTSKNSNHNYVFDVNGTITYDYHTLKCTGCGKTTTEEHDLTRGEDDDCSVCGVHQYYNPSKRASHRYIVNNSNCTQSVYCLATLYPKNSSDYCSEPERLFNRGSHEYEYTNIKETTHDKSCKYCTIGTETEDHDYSITRNGKKYCICGKEEPPCEHEYKYTKINDTKHKYECKLCGQDGEENHSWDNGVVTQPTCTSKGYTTYTCTKCKATKVGNETNKIPHNFEDEWEVVTPATCTADGLEKRVCTICHEETQTRPITAKGHKAGEKKNENRVESTCKEKGHYDEVVYCSVCNTELSRETKYLELASHTEGQPVRENVKDSTCTAEGSYDEVVYCSACNKELSRDKKTIVKKSHTRGEAQRENEIPATCTEDGSYNLVIRCTECGEVLQSTPLTIGKKGHDYDSVVTYPTCTEEGYTTYTCKREGCNHSYTADETDALGHDWDNGTQTVDPTCTEKGNMHFECSRCEATNDEPIEALGHLHRTVDKKDATCLEDGYTEGDYCDRCQTYTSGHEVIKAKGHKVSILEKILATCLGWGKTEGEKCSVCGAILKAQEDVKPLGHDFGEWEVTTEPTCTEDGVETRVCSADRRHTETRLVAATGHDYQAVVTQPTCTEQGYTTHTCSKCNDSYVDTYVNPTGHNLVEDTSVPSTYEETEDGHIRHYTMKCTNEGCNYTEPASETLEHNFVIVNGSDKYLPVEDNKTTHKHTWEEKCEQCNKVITKEGYLAHNWDDEQVVDPTCTEDGYTLHHCRTCGFEYKDEIKEALGHNHPEDSYNVVTEPSCEEDGLAESYCTRCSKDRQTKVLTKTGHAWDEGIVTTPATCVAEGVRTFHCTNKGCNKTKTEPIAIDPTNHEVVIDAAKSATCEKAGLTLGSHCARCQAILIKQEEVPALGHAWGDWKVTTAPTCTEAGVETRVCKADRRHKETRSVDAIGHKPANAVRENIVDSTCTEEGSYDEVVYCETCKAELSRTPKTIEKKAHTPQVMMGKAVTCLEDGYTSYEECSVCHTHLTEPRTIEALGHDFEHGKEVERIDSTCEENGHYTKKCIRCEETHEYPIEAKGHTEVPMMTKMATCTEPGEQGGVKCSVCNTVIVEPTVIPAHGHDYGDWKVTTAPTCTEAGVETRVCSADRRHKETRPVEATGHKPANAVRENIVDSTCTEEGSYDEVVYCETCKAELSRTPKTIEKKAHTPQVMMGKAVTCLVDGYTSYEECAVCHEHLTEPTVLKALGHDFEHGKEVERVDSDCTNAGHYTKKCIRCQETHEYPIEAKGHTEVPMMTKMATCTEPGEQGGVKCSVCNTVIVEPTVITAHDHDYGEWVVKVDPTCTTKGTKVKTCKWDKRHQVTEDIDMLDHTPGQAVIENEVAPTCTQDGSHDKVVYCTKCGNELSRTPVVDKAHGHKYGDWVETKAPKCKEDGEKIRVCEYDETHIETEPIPATGHKWVASEKPNSYKDDGETHTQISWKQCENCGSLLQRTTQYLSHTYGDWTTTKEATCVSEGLKERTCICGHVDTEVIPVDKDAHAYGEWYRWVEPTCTKFGYMRRDCANSNRHYETKAIEKLGHDKEHGTWQVKTKAGNETEGLEVLICGRDNCEEEIDARTIHERKITVKPKTVTYNGENQVGAIIPSEGGYSVEILKGNDKVTSAVNAGEYKLVFTFPETREYNTIILEAVLTIEPAKINPDNIKEQLQALMDKNIDKDYDGTNTVLFDEDDEMTIALDGVEVKVTGTFANELPGENKSADILLAIQDENGNYVFANNETEMSLQKEGNINVIKLTDTFGDINLPNNMIDKKEVSKEIDKKLDKSHRDIKDFKFNDAKISDGEYDIPEVTAYGTKLPASVTFTAIVKDDEGNDVVIIEKKVTGTVTYNYSSGKKKQKKQEQIKDIETPLGLDFEYIDLPRNIETPSDWAKDDIYDLTFKGIVNGYEDMTYRPNNMIRRDEFAKLAYLVLSLKENENGVSKDFEDTKGNWAEEMIRVATTVDVLRGYDDTFFGPADNITNEQMMAILVRGLKYLGKDLRIDNDEDAEEALKAVVDGAEVSDWAKYDAATAVKYGLFIGNENKEIKPLGFTTRAQVAVILERYMNLVADLLK